MKRYLSAADAARLLGVVPATVRQMERDGRLPAQRTMRGMRLFRGEDVEHLVQQRLEAQERTRAHAHSAQTDEVSA